MSKTTSDISKWRLVPDERYYRFALSLFVKVSKSECAHLCSSSIGTRMPMRKVFDLKNKHQLQFDNSYFSSGKFSDVPQDIAERLGPKMDNGTFFSGWISAADPSNNTVQIDIYERLQLPCSDITKISWHSGGFMSPSVSVTVSSRDNSFQYSVDDLFQSITNPTVLDISFHFSPEQWEQFVQPAFQKCNFMAWADKDGYCDPLVFDGQQWGLEVRQGRKRAKNITGSNDYPEEWEIFMRFVSSCLELYKPAGNYDSFYGSLLRYPLDIECGTFREGNGMSKKTLAGLLGVRVKDISEWENGTSKPDGLTLMKLYGIIDMAGRYDIHATFGGNDDDT